ncbi:MAG TPA: DNA polymerase Y family protein [Streptosporangiaceae bacterium]|nr:DNA polymerase Y family protein [Streptosporangiaceae bacterium]
MSDRGAAGDQPPRRIMVVSCPDLHGSIPGPEPGPGMGKEKERARRHERMVTVVTGFCPDVEVVGPGVCAFGARGPARYFGGETALATRIIAALADPSGPAQVQVGVADGLFAALLAVGAARGREHGTKEPAHPVTVVPPGGTPGFLAAQPVSVLASQNPADLAGQNQAGQDQARQDQARQDLASLLARLGLGTLGDFAALPARDVASRFGDPGERAHRLARGLDSRPLATRPPPADLSVTQKFDPPEPRAEPVVFAAKALAEKLHDGLAARGLTCVRVQVTATWADGQESSRRWRHDGLLSAAAVAERVRWQLDGWHPAAEHNHEHNPEHNHEHNPEGGIATLQLIPDQVVRATGQQLALWGETTVSDQVARAALRIQALLGHEAVLRPVTGGGRNVDDQVTATPFGEKAEPHLPGGRPWPGRVMGPAPSLVFPAAREAAVTDDKGNPVTVSGRCELSGAPARLAIHNEPPRRVTGWAGPWPLSERWWDPAAARRRARFQLATDDGRAWLAVVQGGRWLVEAGYWLWAGRTRRSPGGSCNAG